MEKKQKREIIYNAINCALAGLLVFLGGISTGQITSQTLIVALIACMVTFCTQFKEYWQGEVEEVTKPPKKLLTFI
jgi:hypothetical protein